MKKIISNLTFVLYCCLVLRGVWVVGSILWWAATFNSQGATVSPKGKEVFVPTLSVLRVPKPPEAAVQRAVTNIISLGWTDTNQPAPRYRVSYGPDKNTLTNVVNAGSTNSLTITNSPTAQTRYGVRAYREDKESVFSELIKSPPNIIRSFWVDLPDGRKIILGRTTNTPPGQSGFFKVKYSETKDYSP